MIPEKPAESTIISPDRFLRERGDGRRRERVRGSGFRVKIVHSCQ
jgi:hypothetical protein